MAIYHWELNISWNLNVDMKNFIKFFTLVEFILIGCSVLMRTNLIDKLKMLFILEHVDQTGSANRLDSCLCWLFANENRLRTKIKTLTLIADIDWNQDQLFRGIKWLISRTVLDQATKVIWRTTRARMATNAWFQAG